MAFNMIWGFVEYFSIFFLFSWLMFQTTKLGFVIARFIRWLDHNIDEAHTIIAEDSYDLKDKIELYLEGVDEFG